jgi:hypothetical protein
MAWRSSIQVFTTSEDFTKYNTTPSFTARTWLQTNQILFPNFTEGSPWPYHPFNAVLPHKYQQPILDLIYELCYESATIFEGGQYQIRDIQRFQNVCLQHQIRYTCPPVPTLTRPTNNPVFYSIISEYYNLFATAHRTSAPPLLRLTHRCAPPEQLPYNRSIDLTVEPHHSESVNPTVAAISNQTPDSDTSDSESSYSEAEQARAPNGKILIASRLASWNHGVRCENKRQAKRQLADPTYTYTPRELIVAPLPRKRIRTSRKQTARKSTRTNTPT